MNEKRGLTPLRDILPAAVARLTPNERMQERLHRLMREMAAAEQAKSRTIRSIRKIKGD